MPPEEENRKAYGERRHHVSIQVHTCIRTAELCFGLRPSSGHTSVDSLTGDIQAVPDEGQILTISRFYKTSDGTNKKIEIAISPTGTNWNPGVTFTQDASAPVTLIFHKERDRTKPDPLDELMRLIVEALRGLK
jgi:hypothetical protein